MVLLQSCFGALHSHWGCKVYIQFLGSAIGPTAAATGSNRLPDLVGVPRMKRGLCAVVLFAGVLLRTGQVVVRGAPSLGVLRDDADWVGGLGLCFWCFCCMGGCALCDRTQYI